MTMQGQGDSPQPGEGADALDDLANALMGKQEGEPERDADPEASEGDEGEQEVDSEGAEAEDEEPAEEATFTITHDGKEVSLKQSELIEQAQKGFDYTKKAMAVAEERKAAEAEKSRAAEFRAKNEHAANETLSRLEAFKTYMEGQIGSPPPIEWAQQDAAYYLAQKEIYEQRKGQLSQAQAAIEHLNGERQRERQAYLSDQGNQTIEHLKNTLPGWNENSLSELEKYVQAAGLTPQLMDAGYVQKGLWEMAHKAKAYDAIQAQKAQMKPAQQLTKVAKPSAVNTTGKAAERIKRQAEFNKNPSVDALANLLR